MKDYVMTLLGASLLTGILGTLCPEKHKKHLRLLCGLCTIALLIAPLSSYLSEIEWKLPELEENGGEHEENIYDEIYHQTLSKVNIQKAENSTKNLIIQLFSLKNEDVFVSLDIAEENGNALVKKATVQVSGKAVLVDPREIKKYVEELLKCPCEIVYDSC